MEVEFGGIRDVEFVDHETVVGMRDVELGGI